FRAAIPKINQIDRITRRVHTHETQHNLNICWSDFAFDDVIHLERERFRSVHMSPRWRSEPYLKLASIHPWKNLRAELPADKPNCQTHQDQVHAQPRPTQTNHLLRKAGIASLEPRKSALLFPLCALFMSAQEPH